MEQFSIVSKGELLANLSESQVLENLSTLFQRPVEQLLPLLRAGKILKTNLNPLTAQRYLLRLQQTGLAVKSRLQTSQALFSESLVFSQDEPNIEPVSLCYDISLKSLVARLVAKPCSEELRSPESHNYQLTSHRWWLSPVFIGLATLLATPQIQLYLLRVGMVLTTGIGLTIVGIIVTFLLLVFLPPLLGIQRLCSLRNENDSEPLVLKETFSKNPLLKCYTLTTEEECFYIKLDRYKKGKASFYDDGGELLFYLKDSIQADEIFEDIASDIRQNIASLGVIDRISHFFEYLFKDNSLSDIEKTKQSPDYVFGFYNAEGQVLGLAYKGSAGVIELTPQRYDHRYTAHLLLLGLVGLGVN